MSAHCRCRKCRARRKLSKHPSDYRVQPLCSCGARDWVKDAYRHRVELEQIRKKIGRYQICDCPGLGKGFTHRHRIGSKGCCYLASGEPKSDEQALAEHQALLAE